MIHGIDKDRTEWWVWVGLGTIHNFSFLSLGAAPGSMTLDPAGPAGARGAGPSMVRPRVADDLMGSLGDKKEA